MKANLILVSGLSGSGKSATLHVLEDMGWYCVDNLPATLLPSLVEELLREDQPRMAVAIDSRSGGISCLGKVLTQLSALNLERRLIFLEAADEVIIARYGGTRRRHPQANAGRTLAEAIAAERLMLEDIAILGRRVDTSHFTPTLLLKELQALLAESPAAMTLQLLSFAYRDGVPRDADLVFDARCLPNPHYEASLRPLDGRDVQIARYFEVIPEADQFRESIRRFLKMWLPYYQQGQRDTLTLAIGCTGGRHRSVFIAHSLAPLLEKDYANINILLRHRSLNTP